MTQENLLMKQRNFSLFLLKYLNNKISENINGIAHIIYLWRKITILSCHRYLILKGNENINKFEYRNSILTTRCH